MREQPGEGLLAWEGWAVRVGERSACSDDARGSQLLPVCGDDDELTVFLPHRHDARVRPDLDVERGGVALEVVGLWGA
jgi:hypothetical protein